MKEQAEVYFCFIYAQYHGKIHLIRASDILSLEFRMQTKFIFSQLWREVGTFRVSSRKKNGPKKLFQSKEKEIDM